VGGVGGRGALLAPLADFADFGDDDVLGFGGVEGKGMPEDVVMVHVSVGVKNGAVSLRLFEEGPADEVARSRYLTKVGVVLMK
jgi:hypothetical protein